MSDNCVDCGIPREQAHPAKLSRGRCHRCYQRHVYALKKAGAFERIVPPAPLERFLAAQKPASNGCILWTGTINPVSGYGTLSIDHAHHYAHRFSYAHYVGPIPDGMHIDHVCHNQDLTCIDDSKCLHRRCVNPDHLEAVTPKDNITRSHLSRAGRNSRKTHCKRGHEFTPENTLIYRDGRRECRNCRNRKQREYGARKRAQKGAT